MSNAPRPLEAPRIAHTLWTLLFATAVCVGTWCLRAYLSHGARFLGYVWNLFLAWVPLLLALALRRNRIKRNRLGEAALALAWLLFFPNAFYIVTDLIHFTKFGTDHMPKWFDCLMTVSFACAGMFLGSLSLYLMQLLVRARWGWRWGWAFAVGMLALGAIGIYLGRIGRMNSWDVITRPTELLGEVRVLVDPVGARSAWSFSTAYFFFTLTVYLFVVSLARLHEAPESPRETQVLPPRELSA